MRDYCIANGIVDNSAYQFVKLYKVFHPRRMLYAFNQSGLMFFTSADKFDSKEGKYESNKRREIRKCDAMYFHERQHEPVIELRKRESGPTPIDISISRETLMQMIAFHMRFKSRHLSFETRDLQSFFENENRSLSDAERVFESCDSQELAMILDRMLDRLIRASIIEPPVS